MLDPEIRDLQVATARAYAVAERLAQELESTVEDLLYHVDHFRDADGAHVGPPEPRSPGA